MASSDGSSAGTTTPVSPSVSPAGPTSTATTGPARHHRLDQPVRRVGRSRHVRHDLADGEPVARVGGQRVQPDGAAQPGQLDLVGAVVLVPRGDADQVQHGPRQGGRDLGERVQHLGQPAVRAAAAGPHHGRAARRVRRRPGTPSGRPRRAPGPAGSGRAPCSSAQPWW